MMVRWVIVCLGRCQSFYVLMYLGRYSSGVNYNRILFICLVPVKRHWGEVILCIKWSCGHLYCQICLLHIIALTPVWSWTLQPSDDNDDFDQGKWRPLKTVYLSLGSSNTSHSVAAKKTCWKYFLHFCSTKNMNGKRLTSWSLSHALFLLTKLKGYSCHRVVVVV